MPLVIIWALLILMAVKIMTRTMCIFLLQLALTINPTYALEGNTGTSNDELESSKTS